ncbi:developmental pluripotency-associated protein 2 [Manis javanica]|uniref:developmental pluripotency-associated protein 2 n=1 Tax=Manis javanica TaxID=9974 RepID=UPI0008130B90|nr:developmental pluripotency-associated protein 2 [Manis javanica]
MAYSNCESSEKTFSEEKLDEENVFLTLVPVNEEANEHQMEPSVSSTSEMDIKMPVTNSKVHLPQTHEQFQSCPKPSPTKPPLPLPTVLPPIRKVRWDTLQNWCRQCSLSTAGRKMEVYLRLQKHAYSEKKQNIPESTQEYGSESYTRKFRTAARAGTRKHKIKREEGTHIVEVVTSAQEALLAAWARIAAKAIQPKSANSRSIPASAETFLVEASGVRWCVVHGRPLLAKKKGWVRLQFHAGQTWVPDTPKKMISLFLLPACTFPSPDMEDNMLCPECVKRNKRMMKRLIKMRRQKQPGLNTPALFLLDRPYLNEEEKVESPPLN